MKLLFQERTNLVGVLSALFAAFFFSINDVAIKFLSGGYALHQIVLFRSIIGLSVIMIFFVPMSGGLSSLKTKNLKIHIIRGLCVVFANLTFFLGLSQMALAETVALFFISPLVITIFSVIFLKEHVSRARWLAVGIGMLGVIVMMRPDEGVIQLAAFFPLAAAFGYATLHILTRKLGTTESATTMSFYIQFIFIIVSLIAGLVFGHGEWVGAAGGILDFMLRSWSWPEIQDIPVFFLIGFASALGGFLISQAYKLCEAGLASPFEYIALPLSVLWGVTIFGEWPTALTFLGIALIMFAGLSIFWFENVHPRLMAYYRRTF